MDNWLYTVNACTDNKSTHEQSDGDVDSENFKDWIDLRAAVVSIIFVLIIVALITHKIYIESCFTRYKKGGQIKFTSTHEFYFLISNINILSASST